MAKTNNTKIIDNKTLKTINLKPTKNYVGDFADSIASDLIQVKRWKMPNADLLNYLSKIDDKSLNGFLVDIKKPIAESDKIKLVEKIQKYFNDNPLLTIQIADKNKKMQIAFIMWYKSLNDKSGLIKSASENKSLNRFILTNANLDKSFGTQAENPRIKISACVNAILNYQLFASYENQKKLLFDKPIYANDLIDDEKNKFGGVDIINRGYYDSPDYFGKSKTDSSDSDSDTSDSDSDTSDNYMDL